MSYTPINSPIYLAAYAGALAGMGACVQPINNVSNPSILADVFSQAVDQAWNSASNTALDLASMRESCEAAWENRSPFKTPDATTVGAYAGIATEIVALVRAGTAKVQAEGIDPNAGGGSGVTSVSGTAPIVSSGGATPAISITPATDVAAGSMSATDKTKLDQSVPATFVFRPGGVAGGNVFTDFNLLYAAATAFAGGMRVVVDDSIQSPAVIQPKTGGGAYTLTNWHFAGIPNIVDASGGASLQFASGVTIASPTTITFYGVSVSYAGTTPCITLANGQEVNLYFEEASSLICTSTGVFVQTVAGSFGFILGYNATFGDGTHAVGRGSGTGTLLVVGLDGTNLTAGAITASISGSSQYHYDAASAPNALSANVFQIALDIATGISYVANNAADWPGGVAPTNPSNALDLLAAKNFGQDLNASGVSGGGSPVTISDGAAYTPESGAKAVLVAVTFAGSVAGESSTSMTCQPMRGGSTMGASFTTPIDTAGKFGGSVTVIDTQNPGTATYGIRFSATGGSITVAVGAVQFSKADL